jgi:hypothetical protein
VGMDYHLETTRFDYSVPVFTVIARGGIIYMKKFVFRFRKPDTASSTQGISLSGLPTEPISESQNERRERYLKLMGDKERGSK